MLLYFSSAWRRLNSSTAARHVGQTNARIFIVSSNFTPSHFRVHVARVVWKPYGRTERFRLFERVRSGGKRTDAARGVGDFNGNVSNFSSKVTRGPCRVSTPTQRHSRTERVVDDVPKMNGRTFLCFWQNAITRDTRLRKYVRKQSVNEMISNETSDVRVVEDFYQ